MSNRIILFEASSPLSMEYLVPAAIAKGWLPDSSMTETEQEEDAIIHMQRFIEESLMALTADIIKQPGLTEIQQKKLLLEQEMVTLDQDVQARIKAVLTVTATDITSEPTA